MAATSKTVKSIGEFISQISAQANKWRDFWERKRKKNDTTAIAWLPWFRGEPSIDVPYPLRPKLYRRDISGGKELDVLLECEGELRIEFQRCASQLIIGGREPKGKWERYFLMQHFSASTRLLDWTDGALMALHFAMKDRGAPDDKYGKSNPVVYMLDPWSLNRKAFKSLVLASKSARPVGVALPDWDEAKPYLKNAFNNEKLGKFCPLAIDPSQFSRRIAAQRSHFTIFGREPDGLREAVENTDGTILHSFEVDGKQIPTLKQDLKVCGISESSAYPDLEGLGRELEQTLNGYLQKRLE
jgi:hypothetical protein